MPQWRPRAPPLEVRHPGHGDRARSWPPPTLARLDTALGGAAEQRQDWPAHESWLGSVHEIRDEFRSRHVGQPNLFPRHRVSEDVAAFHGVVGELHAVDRGKLATQPRVRRSGPLAVQVAGQL